MNRFNDIIKEDKVLEIPQYLDKTEEYGSLIEKAFAMTNGLLSFDDISIEEDDRHITIAVTSKNVETQFKLNHLDNNRVNQKDLIRGLNKTLTDIFYLGDERFHSLNGKVMPSAIGFVSNRQKRHLLKEGLIGEIKDKPIEEKTSLKNTETNVKEEEIQTTQENPPGTKHNAQENNESSGGFDRYAYIDEKLKKENNLGLFKIIHYPENYSDIFLQKAKKMALAKGVPVLNKIEFEEKLKLYEGVINDILKLKNPKQISDSIQELFEKSNLDRKDKFLILSEVQERIDNKTNSDTWKIVLKIILAIISLLIFLAKIIR